MKILVVDDHALIREALRAVLKELRNDLQLVEASAWRHAAREMERNPDIDVVLLDLGLPDRDGFNALAELRQRHPAVSVVVLSGHHARENVARALDLGAIGFIPKSSPRDVMLSALSLIFSGGMYIPPEFLAQKQAAGRRRPMAGARPAVDITGRQMDVLALMMQGMSNKAICRALALAEPTVKNHVTAILKALNARNRTEAVVAANALGIDPRRGSGPP